MIRLVLEQPAMGESAAILLRSKLRAVAQRIGFPEVQRERMELVCTEILSNQHKYGRGSGLFQIWESRLPTPVLDLFSVDFGPGIPDVAEAFRDGYTTSGTLGHGLGTVQRLAHHSAIYSLTEEAGRKGLWHGVAVWARFQLDREACLCGCQAGAYLRAYHDAPQNGDCICVHCRGNKLRWLHMDGLGHGEEAASAVCGMERFLEQDDSLMDIMESISSAMRGNRGAVGVVGEMDPANGRVALCGVGDMMAMAIGEDGRHNFPFSPGILGHAHRRFETPALTLGNGTVLITASDGLRRTWDKDSFPGLWRLHPQMVALLLGNIVGRASDDKSVFVVKTTAA